MPSLLDTLDLSPGEVEKINSYIDLLYKFDKSKRLIGSQNKEDWLVNNIEDSIKACRLIENTGPIYDMGSGNGLPGIIYSILYPDSDITLLDIDKKKCEFLKTAAYRLKLPCKIANLSIKELDLENVPRRTTFLFRAFSPKDLYKEFILNNVDYSHVVFVSESQTLELNVRSHKNYVLSNGTSRKLALI